MAYRHTRQQAPVEHLDAPFAADLYSAYELADAPTHAVHSTQLASMKGPPTETRSTETYQELTESEALPKDLAC